MSKKYKELPAFETNEFKVGDRVRFYEDCDANEGEVVHVSMNVIEVHGINYGIHFKQCRKLEEVKPREFWIHSPGGYLVDTLSTDDRVNLKAQGYIKLREVLE
jgi:hypothetical protein